MSRATAWLTAAALLVAVPVVVSTVSGADVSAAGVPTQPCPTDEITPGVTPRAQYISDRLRTAGYSPAATAGVLGNLDYLSALTPTAQSESGQRTGLGLWGAVRWKKYTAYASSLNTNRWFLSTQVSYLLREMAADPGRFHDDRFRRSTDPVAAAGYFHRRLVDTDVPRAQVAQTRGAKAKQWARTLAGRPVDTTPSDNSTYGLFLTCEPVTGTVERCPVVPPSAKADFARFTGLQWDRMSDPSQLASRCVYANFPRIRIHGTYRSGHMPSWDRALDFMMPLGCRTGPDRSWTTSPADEQLGSRLAQYLLRRGERFSLDYVIWQDRARNPGSEHDEDPFAPIETWREDTYNNGDCTNTHFDHVHMSVERGA